MFFDIVNTTRRQLYKTHADNVSNQIKLDDLGNAFKKYFQSEPLLVKDPYIKKAEKERKFFYSIEKQWWNNNEKKVNSKNKKLLQHHFNKFWFNV